MVLHGFYATGFWIANLHRRVGDPDHCILGQKFCILGVGGVPGRTGRVIVVGRFAYKAFTIDRSNVSASRFAGRHASAIAFYPSPKLADILPVQARRASDRIIGRGGAMGSFCKCSVTSMMRSTFVSRKFGNLLRSTSSPVQAKSTSFLFRT